MKQLNIIQGWIKIMSHTPDQVPVASSSVSPITKVEVTLTNALVDHESLGYH
jgi:hypothetical protein